LTLCGFLNNAKYSRVFGFWKVYVPIVVRSVNYDIQRIWHGITSKK